MTFSHIGLILTVIGTGLLAYAVRIENKWTLSAKTKAEKKHYEDIVTRAEDGTYKEPTIVFINKYMFYIGLMSIATGTLMQW
jgi:hypothetical protein